MTPHFQGGRGDCRRVDRTNDWNQQSRAAGRDQRCLGDQEDPCTIEFT
jgi:hypothetical protein